MRVSLIITNYNYAEYVGRSIQSALNQNVLTKNFYEVIIIDDGSTDASKKVVESYRNDVKVIYNDRNYGLPYSINKAIKASNGMYVLRLDSDDWIDNNCLQILSMFLDNYKDFDYVWPDYNLYDKKENIIGINSKPLGAGVMFRKKILFELGLYDENMLINEDKDILIRCQNKYKGYHIKLPLYKYFKHGKSMTSNFNQVKKFDNLLNEKHQTT